VIRLLQVSERVFALDLDCTVYCLRVEDGALLGTVPAGPTSAWGAALLAHDGALYVATSDGVTALSMDGHRMWSYRSEDPGLEGILPGLALPGVSVQPDKKD
jgi:outer membrane protein assembly factor BamB